MCGGGGIIKSVLPIAGALVGSAIGGPMGAALGYGASAKLTGQSTRNALLGAGLSYLGGNIVNSMNAGTGIAGGFENAFDVSGNFDKLTGGLSGLAGGFSAPVTTTPVTSVPGAAITTGGQTVIPMASVPGTAITTAGPTLGTRILGSLTSTPALLGMVAAGVLGAMKPEEAPTELHYNLPSSRSESGVYKSFGNITPLNRQYMPSPDPRTAGFRGEHTYFQPNPGFAYAHGGRVSYAPPSSRQFDDTNLGLDSGDVGSKDTGNKTVSTLSEFGRAVLGGLSMMSPIGLAAGLISARQGMPGTIVDAYRELGDIVGPYGQLGHQMAPIDNYGTPTSNFPGMISRADLEAKTLSEEANPPGSMAPPDAPPDTSPPSFSDYGDPMAKGGQIRGPGGGQDDLIPATIEDRDPARLSNDEFVMPADVVAIIGDGSSSQGHRKLYDLIAAARKQAYGRNRQMPRLNMDLAGALDVR